MWTQRHGLPQSNTLSSASTPAPTSANDFLPKHVPSFFQRHANAALDIATDMRRAWNGLRVARGANALDFRCSRLSMLAMLKLNMGKLCTHLVQALKVRQAKPRAQRELTLRPTFGSSQCNRDRCNLFRPVIERNLSLLEWFWRQSFLFDLLCCPWLTNCWQQFGRPNAVNYQQEHVWHSDAGWNKRASRISAETIQAQTRGEQIH